jgi:hypothetical protein
VVGGAAPPDTNITSIKWPTPTEPWYVVQAAGNRDGDTVLAIFVSSSFSGEIFSQDETE